MPRQPKGSYPGRRKGSKNKATIERELLAAREQAARDMALQDAEDRIITARRAGQKLGREVLEEFMNLGVNLAAHYQMNPPGQQTNPNEDWDKFWKAAEFATDCAKEVASFQSPKLKAIMVASPAPDLPDDRKRFTITVFEGGATPKPKALPAPDPMTARRTH